MSLASIRDQIEKLQSVIITEHKINYACARTADGNLLLNFADSNVLKIPLIDLRLHQLKLQRKMFVEGYKRIYVWRPRRAGKEVESWNMIIEGALETPGLYIMIYPTNVRARMILWDGAIVMPDGSSMKFLDMIPKSLILGNKNQQEMSIKLVNGSIIRIIGSDIDPEKLRGINARGVVMSEYAFCDPRVRLTLMPMLRQNGGWLILQTTPNSMNHAYHLMQEMKSNPDWFCEIDNAETIVDCNGNRYITDEMIDEDRRSGMPEWMIRQEYYCDVQINSEVLYFSNEIKFLREENKIIPNLILSGKRVRAFLDIGMSDSTAVCLVQFTNDKDPIIIAYYENNNKTFEHYIQWSQMFCTKHNLIFDSIFVPHDGQKRDFNTGENTVDFGNKLGYQVYVVPRPTSKINAIQSTRMLLYRTKFNKENTARLIDCISNYSKSYDEKRGIYKDQPIHDWTSHGVDSYQTMVLAKESGMINDTYHEIAYYAS